MQAASSPLRRLLAKVSNQVASHAARADEHSERKADVCLFVKRQSSAICVLLFETAAELESKIGMRARGSLKTSRLLLPGGPCAINTKEKKKSTHQMRC